MRKTTKIVLFFLLFWLVAFSGTIVHECGHAITAFACGFKVHGIGSAPGIIIYPKLSFYRWTWNDPIAWCAYDQPEVAWKFGLCALMGSGATTIVGYLVLLVILVFRPARWKWAALAMIVIVYIADLPTYVIFPKLGLRRAIFVGGTSTEPLDGAVAMGMPEWAFYIFVAIDILLVSGLLLYSALRLKRNNEHSKEAVSASARTCTKTEQHP